ncbi:MAG: glycosyltransferase family 4 protein, partial [Candidatus Bathyarchaeia archaeon]
MVEVLAISPSYKLNLYNSLSKYFPLSLKIISAEEFYAKNLFSEKRSILPSIYALKKIMKLKPDVVLTDYAAYPSWYAKLYSILKRKRIPLLVWLLGDFWREYFAYFPKAKLSVRLMGPFYFFTWSKGLEFSDRIIAVCKWLEKILNNRFPEKPTSTLHVGIDPEVWLKKEDEFYPFKKPSVGILQDNNILPKVKGLLWFSNVVKEMRDVNFYIAGGGPYTPLVKKAYSKLRNAHFLGRLSHPDGVRKFYASCDLYALPSGLDCCPVTLLEASACGKPVIASRVGGIPELIEEGLTGWTIENGKLDEWVEKIYSILSDKELEKKYGEEGRK